MKAAILYHSVSGNTKKMADLIREGCESVEGVEARSFPVEEVDWEWVKQSRIVIFGSPTYEGTCSWQMKELLDNMKVDLGGKLGGVFTSQNWPGGGGGDLAEITLIAAMLVLGMLVYSGGITRGQPFLHFGAVSARSPEGLYAERCIKLGQNLAAKAKEVFPHG